MSLKELHSEAAVLIINLYLTILLRSRAPSLNVHQRISAVKLKEERRQSSDYMNTFVFGNKAPENSLFDHIVSIISH